MASRMEGNHLVKDQFWINIVDGEPDQLPDFLRNPNHAPSPERLLDVAHNCGCDLVDLALTPASEPADTWAGRKRAR